MSYQVARDGTTIGTFNEEQLIEAVEEGRILTTDDAWTEGMDEWVTVESLLEIEELEETELDAPTLALPRPKPVPLGLLNAAGRAPTSHYQPIATPAAPDEPTAAPPFRAPPMIVGQQPPIMVKGGRDPAAGRYGTAGTAIASLVLGIISIVGFIFTAVPAIICGHKALDKIRRTNGAFAGQGIAVAGLTLGYIMLVVSIGIVAVKFILPAIGSGH